MPRINKTPTPASWIPAPEAHKQHSFKEKRYNTRRWKKARLDFLKQQPLCNDCGRLANVVDHITPVRLGGDFWNSDNWQPLCEHCHARKSGLEAHI